MKAPHRPQARKEEDRTTPLIRQVFTKGLRMEAVLERERSGPELLQEEEAAGDPVPSSLPPLNVSGLVVTGEDLVVALRPYIPLLVNITPLSDGRFILSFTEPVTPPAGY
jgi:hypothetical protein